MKSFRHYLVESVKTYNYKIKIAGEAPKNFYDMFCYNLQKFDPVKISDAKVTPIQKDPYGFPGLKDQSVAIINVEFRYPATEPMIKQVARLLGYDENLVRMIQANYDDSVTQEAEEYANQPNPVLTAPYEDEAGAKQAAKDYGDSYLKSIKKQHQDNNDQINMPYAGKKTAPAFDPFVPYLSKDNKSPMSQVTRSAKPPTGATMAKRK
jgi:hypothetical protein